MYGAVMRDLLLQIAGAAAIIVAIAHGIIGEKVVFARATIEPPRTRLLLRLIWQAGTIAWIASGALLIAAPLMQSEMARHWIVANAVITYAAAATGNAIATRFRHVGWAAMAVISACAIAGY